MNYFKQKTFSNEIGSSIMPHKINPIDFENSEGNLGISNAIMIYLSKNLPISRLQRDLTDSTTLRNVGTAIGHSLVAYESILKGMRKITINNKVILSDLEKHVEILAEPIQTIMRRYGMSEPYEKLKNLTRNKKISLCEFKIFIDQLDLPEKVKNYLKNITVFNYTGIAKQLCRDYLK